MWNNQPPSGYPPHLLFPAPEGVIPPQTIRFLLIMPITRIGSGLFSFDPLEKLLGSSIEEILKPAMLGPVYRRPSLAGPAVNVYPLGLPPGEGLSLRLGHFGELGFANDAQYLRLAVPWQAGNWVQQRLAHAIVRGPERALSSDGTSWVAWIWLRLQPGMGMGMPISGIGEVGVEAG